MKIHVPRSCVAKTSCTYEIRHSAGRFAAGVMDVALSRFEFWKGNAFAPVMKEAARA